MKQCIKCGTNLMDNAVFCTSCGERYQESESTPSQHTDKQSQQQSYFVPAEPADNRKAFCVMSYILVFWLFGLFSSPEKNDPRVRFNVGQGLIASVVSVGLGIGTYILSLLFDAVFVTEKIRNGIPTGVYEPSLLAGVLNTFMWIITIGVSVFFAVWGIVKVLQNKDTYLPVVGKFSFYK